MVNRHELDGKVLRKTAVCGSTAKPST